MSESTNVRERGRGGLRKGISTVPLDHCESLVKMCDYILHHYGLSLIGAASWIVMSL